MHMYKDSTKRLMKANRKNSLLPTGMYKGIKKLADEFLDKTPNPKGYKYIKRDELKKKHKEEHNDRIRKANQQRMLEKLMKRK